MYCKGISLWKSLGKSLGKSICADVTWQHWRHDWLAVVNFSPWSHARGNHDGAPSRVPPKGKLAPRSAWSQLPRTVGGLGICPNGQLSQAAVQAPVTGQQQTTLWELVMHQLLTGWWNLSCPTHSSLTLSQVSAAYRSWKASPKCSSSSSLFSSPWHDPQLISCILSSVWASAPGKIRGHTTFNFTWLYWEAHREDTGK